MIAIVEARPARSTGKAATTLGRLLDVLGYRPGKPDVFIKPNMVDAVPPSDAVDTDPFLVGGLILALAERGGKRFVVGDGSGYFSSDERTWTRLVDESGYGRVMASLRAGGVDVELVNLETTARVEVPWAHGTIAIPELCQTHVYINFAKMKTHVHTTVSLATKNQKGLLALADKKAFHLRTDGDGLHGRIKALGAAVRPELALVDGTRALEGSGPSTAPGGQTAVRHVNAIIGGRDMAEVDAAACTIIGIPPAGVRHLRAAGISLAPGSDPLVPATPPFAMPSLDVKMGEKVSRCAFETCCTGCQMALSRLFRKMLFTPALRERFLAWQAGIDRAVIVMGKGETTSAPGALPIFFGTCTRQAWLDRGGVHVPGCPPDHGQAIEIMLSTKATTRAREP